MARKRRTTGIVLACLLFPPLLVSGLLKAGHYTFRTWTNSSIRPFWFAGRTGVIVNDEYTRPIPGFSLVLYKCGIEAYRPQDVPPPRQGYIISAQVVDRRGHGVSEAELEVYDLFGVSAETETENVCLSGDQGIVTYVVASEGFYNVIVDRHGYLSIKKRVLVGPNGVFVKFVLPRAVRGGAPSRKLPASARR